MIIKNGCILQEDGTFIQGDLIIEKDKIAQISPSGSSLNAVISKQEETLDAEDLYILPGLFDIHIHGCAGHDFCDADLQGLGEMGRYLATSGVTSFLGTSMAFDEAKLKHIFELGKTAIDRPIGEGATLRGIHMEGPYFAKAKKGAQSEKYIVDPDIESFERLFAAADQQIKLVDVAPELPGAMDFIKQVSSITKVSVAHTCSDYNTALEAFSNGASHVTHLFNAMPAFNHREPGVIGAASDTSATVELICDGIHIHPAVVRAVFKWFGAQRVVLISDAMRACGLASGKYDLGGQEVTVDGSRATLVDGTIAGSATNLFLCVKRAVEYGIDLSVAWQSASLNPAKAMGLDHKIGSLAKGKQGDIIGLNKDMSINFVVIAGKRIL